MKPIKRGYKLWCTADQHGYILKFDVYQGKNVQVEAKYSEYGLGERVVLSLSEDYWGQNRQLYFDNYFTTLGLLEKLKVEMTLARDSMRSNRKGLPPNMQNDKHLSTARGNFDYRISQNGIAVFKWFDNKIVYLASNFHGSETSEVKRKGKDGTKAAIVCPAIVPDYNRNMGGVDHADRLRQVYNVDRRSRKWWHRLFWGLLDIAFVNSFLVYKEMGCEENLTLLDFRRGVSLGLMNRASQTKGKKRRSTSSDKNTMKTKRRKYNYSVCNDLRLGNRGNHWAVFVKERRRCEYCSAQGIQSKPHSKCSSCGVFLCLNEKKTALPLTMKLKYSY